MHQNIFQDLLHKHQPGREGLRSGNAPGTALIVPRTSVEHL